MSSLPKTLTPGSIIERITNSLCIERYDGGNSKLKEIISAVGPIQQMYLASDSRVETYDGRTGALLISRDHTGVT